MITKVAPYRVCGNFCANKNDNNINFTGNTKRFGNKVYNGFYEMLSLFPKEKTKSPIVGCLPGYMIKILKKGNFNIEKAVKDIYKNFSEATEEIRSFEPMPYHNMNEFKHLRSDSTVKKLRTVFEKYGILKPYDDFDLVYLGKGGKGSVYKLEGLKWVREFDEDEFVIKIFHTTGVQSNAYHGCYPELNAATYWMRYLGKDTNRGKFYWGDINDAYMINKYIDEDIRLPKYYPNPYKYGMKFTDEDPVHIHNVCKTYSYDWGGGVVINQVINSNKFVRRVMRDIETTPKKFQIIEWYKKYQQKPIGNNDSKMAGLTMAIRYLPEEHRVGCFENCFSKRGKYNDRAMGYTLKYLPHEVALKYYANLAESTNDPVLKRILQNEIPLLSTKDELLYKLQDNLYNRDNAELINMDRFVSKDKMNKFMQIARESRILDVRVLT